MKRKQIMLWEKKIEIQKELQQTLDPEVGQTEILQMKKEIHSMEQTLQDLVRSQKQKIHEMEKAVTKREIIINKGRAIMNGQKKGDTKATIQREIAHLDNEIAKRKQESQKKLTEIKRFQQEFEEAGRTCEGCRAETTKLQSEIDQQQKHMNELVLEKMRVAEEKERFKKIAQKYDDLKRGKYRTSTKSPSDADYLRASELEKGAKIIDILAALQDSHPEFVMELNVVQKAMV